MCAAFFVFSNQNSLIIVVDYMINDVDYMINVDDYIINIDD